MGDKLRGGDRHDEIKYRLGVATLGVLTLIGAGFYPTPSYCNGYEPMPAWCVSGTVLGALGVIFLIGAVLPRRADNAE